MPVGVPGGDAVDAVVGALADRRRGDRTEVLAIDGPSGSGKTTLARAVADRCGGAPTVHMDDLYPGWDGLAAAVATVVEWVLEPLAAGGLARYRRYDWPSAAYAEWHTVPRAPLVIVEGAGSGSRRCGPFVSLLVWVDAPEEVRMRRGFGRDGETYRPHWARWAAQEEALFAAEGTRGRADVRIDGVTGRVVRSRPGSPPG